MIENEEVHITKRRYFMQTHDWRMGGLRGKRTQWLNDAGMSEDMGGRQEEGHKYKKRG